MCFLEDKVYLTMTTTEHARRNTLYTMKSYYPHTTCIQCCQNQLSVAQPTKAEPSQTARSRKEIIGLWEKKGPNQTNLAQSWLGRLTPLHLFHSGALFFYALQPINSTETLQTYFCLIYIEISKIPFLFTNVDRQKGPFKHVMITVETSFDETLAVAVAQKKMKQNSSKVQFASCQAK